MILLSSDVGFAIEMAYYSNLNKIYLWNRTNIARQENDKRMAHLYKKTSLNTGRGGGERDHFNDLPKHVHVLQNQKNQNKLVLGLAFLI